MKLTSPDSDGLSDEEFEEYKSLSTQALEINERKVLKVGATQPQKDVFSTANEMPMNNNNPEMGNEMPLDDNTSDFDTNFDAGVEADEDEDPKKYIQQLTGKLSQELGKYNNELGEPDIELSKYVGGMIVKQVAKNLDDSGKKELIKKIKTTNDNSEENIDFNNNDLETTEKMPMESYNLSKNNLKKLFEMFNDNCEKENDEKLENKKVGVYKKNNKPFSSPKFK